MDWLLRAESGKCTPATFFDRLEGGTSDKSTIVGCELVGADVIKGCGGVYDELIAFREDVFEDGLQVDGCCYFTGRHVKERDEVLFILATKLSTRVMTDSLRGTQWNVRRANELREDEGLLIFCYWLSLDIVYC